MTRETVPYTGNGFRNSADAEIVIDDDSSARGEQKFVRAILAGPNYRLPAERALWDGTKPLTEERQLQALKETGD